MADVILKVDKTSKPGIIIVKVIGPLDNKTSEGFDSWVCEFIRKVGFDAHIQFNLADLEVLVSRAVSTFTHYFEEMSNNGGTMELINVPYKARIVLKKHGLENLGWMDQH